jgi:hypothetical protein
MNILFINNSDGVMNGFANGKDSTFYKREHPLNLIY